MAVMPLLGAAACVVGLLATGVRAQSPPQRPSAVTISAVMIDPARVPDERGEWLELRNGGDRAVTLGGWRLLSARDPGFTLPAGLTVAAHGTVVLARSIDPSMNGGVRALVTYDGLAFANGGDWLALHDASGVTRDSVAWTRAPRGEALRPHGAMADSVSASLPRTRSVSGSSGSSPAPVRIPAVTSTAALIVRVLDVGQGDAILIQNGGSTILIDGGPNPRALGAHLDALGLNGTTIDAVVLSHAHADHYQGLRELFASRRRITVRYFWENGDASPNATLARLRDSIGARVAKGTLVYRDTDDPCATGRDLCVVTMKGGARLEIMRPDPQAQDPNNRSPALKLVGPDSASFTMWMAGDAEQEALDFFERTGYARSPGMKVDVLKADHHGSCNGVSDRYLDLLRPSLVVASVGAMNDYGHMHAQAKAAFTRHGIPWYRTDQNGTITLRSAGTAGSGYTVTVERGTKNTSGPSDRRSTQPGCAGM
jgi:competence protein ComEC